MGFVLLFKLFIVVRNSDDQRNLSLICSATSPAQFPCEHFYTCRLVLTIAACKVFVPQTNLKEWFKCVRQQLISTYSLSTFSKLVWHGKVTIWRWLTVLFRLGFQLHSVPYKSCFLFMRYACHIFQAMHNCKNNKVWLDSLCTLIWGHRHFPCKLSKGMTKAQRTKAWPHTLHMLSSPN